MTGWPDQPGVRFLAYQLANKDALCPGIRDCRSATDVTCRDCGRRYSPEVFAGAKCPACGSGRYLRERCPECGIVKLEDAMQSQAGRLLNRASDLRFALDLGFTVTLDDVSVEVYRALQAYESESAKAQRRKQNGQVSAKSQ